MPPGRWSCGTCGLVNKAATNACAGCGVRCSDLDTGQWSCTGCGMTCQTPTCPGCNYRRPLSKEGVPQIFAGMRVSFTGIIPRSIAHWSEWKEWQQMEQHGGLPMNEISPEMTHLIYKEGFERSDKVRKVQKLGHGIKIVSSEWFYQSINLGVRLDEDPYNLTLPQKRLVAASVQGATIDIASSYAEQLTQIATTARIEPGAAKEKRQRPSQALTEDGDFHWLTPPTEPRPLFQDCSVVFSPGVPEKAKKLAVAYSAKITKALDGADTSHFVVAKADEGSPMVAEAMKKGLQVATPEWILHCIQLHELLPAVGPYEVKAQ
eukprot:TRINITY_DN7316_c0_g1_i1.p1 TRINITY_DN7316_c0_g1~~TRINITY_DN7316_c0_g1_i1.p1  ORF type:complete len:320 (+),score=107.27 TRINITY_DN7316_c0_g1_i1:50-1009(+)